MAKRASSTPRSKGSGRAASRLREEPPPYTTPTRPSALLDTRVIYCGDNLEQQVDSLEFLAVRLEDRLLPHGNPLGAWRHPRQSKARGADLTANDTADKDSKPPL